MTEILNVPEKRVDVVVDTDTYNEIDDQFALAYLLSSGDRCNVLGIYAAPFVNDRTDNPTVGMNMSYDEIQRLLKLMSLENLKSITHKGSAEFLKDKRTPIESEATDDLIRIAREHTSDNPLYIIAIAALTDIASALIKAPDIIGRIIVVWLGGKTRDFPDAAEFNLNKDVKAAQVVFDTCGNRLIQVPCMGCTSHFMTTEYELKHWLSGKNPLCDYLTQSVIDFHKSEADKAWSKPIWDVVAVAWLLNNDERFMRERVENVPVITDDRKYVYAENRGKMKYVYYIKRDALFQDLFEKLADEKTRSEVYGKCKTN